MWAMRVMKFWASQPSNRANRLKFSVMGHSLGGAVALWVLQVLDIPASALRIDEAARSATGRLGPLESLKYIKAREWTTPPYDLCGGHLFNPGASPAILHRCRSRVDGVVRHGYGYIPRCCWWFGSGSWNPRRDRRRTRQPKRVGIVRATSGLR